MTTTNGNKGSARLAYSIDGEDFPYYDPGEAIQALADESRLELGAVYYEIDIKDVDLFTHLDANRLLENASDSLYDEIGEAAETSFNPSVEHLSELSSLLKSWCDKAFAGERYWQYVGMAREIDVTIEDVDSFGGFAAREET